MMVNGSVVFEMDLVSKGGQMVLSMKANGKIIGHMVKENSPISTATSIMEHG